MMTSYGFFSKIFLRSFSRWISMKSRDLSHLSLLSSWICVCMPYNQLFSSSFILKHIVWIVNVFFFLKNVWVWFSFMMLLLRSYWIQNGISTFDFRLFLCPHKGTQGLKEKHIAQYYTVRWVLNFFARILNVSSLHVIFTKNTMSKHFRYI